MNQNPARLCPRFDRCSVNNCPLNLAYPGLYTDPNDREKTCPMEKRVRIRCASQFPPGTLKLDGLTVREHTAKARYEALPVAVKAEMANKGREALQNLRASKQG